MKWTVLRVFGAFSGLLLGLGISETAKAGCSTDGYMGSICFMTAKVCPPGHMEANGKTLSLHDYSDLFSLIGTVYGGDGVKTMQLPDLRGRTAVGRGGDPGVTSVVALGEKRGAETTQLKLENMAPHDHPFETPILTITGTLKANTNAGTENSPAGNYPATSNVAPALNFSKGTPDTTLSEGTLFGTFQTPPTLVTTPTGGNKPFDILGPRIGLLACLRIDGIYPSRN